MARLTTVGATLDGASVGESPPGNDSNVLRFTLGSTLLAVVGAPNEDKVREGVAFLRWEGARFSPIAFFPRDEVCRRVPG